MSASTRWRPRHRSLALVGAFSLGATLGCATLEVPNFRGQAATAQPIVLNVSNQNYADVTVHVSEGSGWQRVGSVTGQGSARLEMPASMSAGAASYRVRIHAIGSRDRNDYVSERIPANRGNVIHVTVAPVLRMSSWSIRD
ncbi:MAG: hypothetical protein U5R14_07825 [Gemmatimonadota bacterium]|nr:hypothetical protein [Gemmatimonadota bacterium]